MSRLVLRDLLIAGVVFLVLLWAPSLLFAQAVAAQCAPWPQWEARLAARWHEAPAWVGLDPGGAQLIVTQAADGSSWSILRLTPDGQACLIHDGVIWSAIDPPLPGERS